MPTYVYETIPQFEGDPPKRFEIRQSMNDSALTQHPDSGQPVRRVPIGGTGIMVEAARLPVLHHLADRVARAVDATNFITHPRP